MSRDIRSFFGPAIPKAAAAAPPKAEKRKSAAVASQSADGAPTPNSPPSKRPKRTPVKQPPVEEVELDDDEELFDLPRSSTSAKKRSNRKRVLLSDDEDEIQIDEVEPPKAAVAAAKPNARRRAQIQSDSSDDEAENERQVIAHFSSGPEDDEEEDEAVEAAPKKRGRKPKEKGLQNISNFAKKLDPKKAAVGEERKPPAQKAQSKRVDSAAFFSAFGSMGAAKPKPKKPPAPVKPVKTEGEVPEKRKKSEEPEESAGASSREPLVVEEPAVLKMEETRETRVVKAEVKAEVEEVVVKKEVVKEHVIKQKSPKQPSVAQEKKPEARKEPAAPQLPALNLRQSHSKLEQWVDKYRPMDLKTLIGQQGDQAPARKLLRWLQAWPQHNLGPASAMKKQKPANARADDGSAFKAALISGPPGIGKTTAARLICDELALESIEMNASDTRNKKLLEQKIGEMLHSQKIGDFFRAPSAKPTVVAKGGRKITSVLIMDEVDGMSGNQDRSGITELIAMIKTAEIPIICICNDRQSQKIRSLANHCFDLRFQRPTVQQIAARMMTILMREGVRVPKEDVERVIQAANQDLRQSIYSLQLLAAGQDKQGGVMTKDVALNTFEAARRLLSGETNLEQKRELFFTDYALMPLFVQEMYLNIRSPTINKRAQLRAQARAAESLALGDVVCHQVRSCQNWTLLPLQGMLGCALPPAYLKGGHLTAQLTFPQWLGKFSNERKRQRLLLEFATHAGNKMSGPLHAIAADYIPLLRQRIIRPLLGNAPDIEETLAVYHEYELLRDDFETINELGACTNGEDLWKKVESKTKSALTRALNKDTFRLSYATDADVQVVARTVGNKRTAAKSAQQKLRKLVEDDDDEEAVEDEAAEDGEAEAMAEILNA
ncbi:Replication factor C subunit 1 [Aphelenchoides fujianensis]|nr:Replication factor C subunit 1 [Aphelenchoides fujianensis]